LNRRQRRIVEEQNTYLDAQERPYIHLVDGALSDNLGIKRIIDSITFAGGLARSLESSGNRGIRKVVFLNVDAGRRNSFAIDRIDKVPSTMEVARGIQFGLLSDQIRAKLLAIPTAYTLDQDQVGGLIDAGRAILEANPEFNRLVADIARAAHSANDAGTVHRSQHWPANTSFGHGAAAGDTVVNGRKIDSERHGRN
jgi:hypothetical protein